MNVMTEKALFPRRMLLAAVAAGIGAPSFAAPRTPARALPLVVIDPGHGGKDPGAIGVSGTYEKHVALAVAQALRAQLAKGGRCRVEMTRTRDVFVPLRGRVAYAQNRGAVLFVSLHADALSDPGVRGASVYTLSDTASDAQTAALARRENSADRFGGPKFADMPPAVASILGSLVRQETRSGSVRIAQQLVAKMRPDLGMLTHPSRQAGFMVLRAADIPSVLVEMGFMSNSQDESALRRPEHRLRIAAVLARAVNDFVAGVGQGPRVSG
ncbi:MAG: N-acetylmuramoyl-L-alanine amidase [Gemmatimonadaceae bacterium]|nr:N-acetylmuramoyl-L-alanine amidase [Acetobacteraceae bacterium]